jgi:hypothetical protein
VGRGSSTSVWPHESAGRDQERCGAARRCGCVFERSRLCGRVYVAVGHRGGSRAINSTGRRPRDQLDRAAAAGTIWSRAFSFEPSHDCTNHFFSVKERKRNSRTGKLRMRALRAKCYLLYAIFFFWEKQSPAWWASSSSPGRSANGHGLCSLACELFRNL